MSVAMHVQVERRKTDGGMWRTQAAKYSRWHGSRHAGAKFLTQQSQRATKREIPKNGID